MLHLRGRWTVALPARRCTMRGPSNSTIARGRNLSTTTTDTAPATTDADAKLSLWTKLAYGVGAIAYGVKDNGFSFFLLIFYSQVIGVDARLVGLAMTIALIVDAIADPIVGYWSDNLRSRWGRRHPFMYAAAIPVAATYYLLWRRRSDGPKRRCSGTCSPRGLDPDVRRPSTRSPAPRSRRSSPTATTSARR